MTDFRCAAASLMRADDLAGTASTVRAFLLVEFAGAWGIDALRDARLPDGWGEEMRRRARESGTRVLLIRRSDRAAQVEGVQVFAAYADPISPWLEAATLSTLDDVLDLDLAALSAGRSVGLPRSKEPVYAVCTHGRHDACCAERGRPVAAALAAARPGETWEVSHIGGDRFAGNLLVLPFGFYYGRLDPAAAVAVGEATACDDLDLDHFRGRSGLGMPVQAAEIALRRHLGETRANSVRFVGATREGTNTQSRFTIGVDEWLVTVRTTPGDRAQLTCRAEHEDPVPRHEVVALQQG